MPPPRPSVPPPQRPRRGRPPGSVSLTEEMARRIVDYIRAGAFAEAAARAAGVPDRTFRDWMARGEGTHPNRSATPKLRSFVKKVRRAQAEARVAAEVRVYREHPRYWLSRAARSTREAPGWTDPGPGEEVRPGDSLEERVAELQAEEERRAARAAAAAVALDPTADYERIYADELERIDRTRWG